MVGESQRVVINQNSHRYPWLNTVNHKTKAIGTDVRERERCWGGRDMDKGNRRYEWTVRMVSLNNEHKQNYLRVNSNFK